MIEKIWLRDIISHVGTGMEYGYTTAGRKSKITKIPKIKIKRRGACSGSDRFTNHRDSCLQISPRQISIGWRQGIEYWLHSFLR